MCSLPCNHNAVSTVYSHVLPLLPEEGTPTISLHVQKKAGHWSQVPTTTEYNQDGEEIDTFIVAAG